MPVDSAIAVRDGNTQVTIMNERAQGGAAGLSDSSTIELMQHRRLLEDDDLGVDEFLNETDSDLQGIFVTAKYYMQIFDQVKGHSNQRSQQINIDQPLQYFFSFDYKLDKSALTKRYRSQTAVSGSNFARQGTYRAFPLQKNQILVRFENLADRFDAQSNSSEFVNVDSFARDLYIEVNDKLPQSVKIEELSLSANQLKQEMDDARFPWKGEGDDKSMVQSLSE